MVKRLYYDGRAFALGIVGIAALLATLVGEYLMHDPAQAQFWHACVFGNCPSGGSIGLFPLPATAVVLPGRSTLDITIYQVTVLILGAVILVGALACAARRTHARRIVLAVAAVFLALTLLFFRAQAPLTLIAGFPQCDQQTQQCVRPQQVTPYVGVPFPSPDNRDQKLIPLIDSVWFMTPAAALGLLTAGIALLSARRRAS